MKRGNKKLAYEDRIRIELYVKDGLSNNEIGKRLGRSPSSITREIGQNKGGPERWHYTAKIAHALARYRQRKAALSNPRKAADIWIYVEEKIRLGWSPEIISGRISQDLPGQSVSHESVYQYVYGQGFELVGYLATRRPFRRPKGPRRAKKSLIPNRLSIQNRPDHINHREEVGHWESDSVVCSQAKDSLNVMVERYSRFAQITKIANLTALATQEAIINRLKYFDAKLRQSLTYDNGFENRNHEVVNQALESQSYFCEPYHSWEKGSVEQVNMLIRRYIPKKTDLSTVTEKDIAFVETQLNNRPRKCLGYKTPSEIFNSFL